MLPYEKLESKIRDFFLTHGYIELDFMYFYNGRLYADYHDDGQLLIWDNNDKLYMDINIMEMISSSKIHV